MHEESDAKLPPRAMAGSVPAAMAGRLPNGEAAGTLTSSATVAGWREGLIPAVCVGLLVAFAFPFLRKAENSEWHTCYVRAAHRLSAHERLHYIEPNAYAYPPAMAMLALPLAHWPPQASLAAWYLINVAALAVLVGCCWRLAGGPRRREFDARWRAVFWVALALALRFVLATMENQQFDVVISALMMVGCCRLWRGRDISASLWLGAAAAMKCTPLLFAPYLVWRGKLKAAAVLVLVAVALNRLPDLFWPKTGGGCYLGDWASTFLFNLGDMPPGIWQSDLLLNQSLSGLVNRYLQAGLPLHTGDLPTGAVNFTASQVFWIRFWTYSIALLLLALTAWRFGRFGCAAVIVPAETARPLAWHHLQTPIETSAVICLMLLLSPMSSKAHYVMLLLPCVLVARAAVEAPRRWGWLLAPLAIAGPLSSKALTGKVLGDLMLAWGIPTWFVLLSLAAMWQLRGRCPRPVRAVAPPAARRLRAA